VSSYTDENARKLRRPASLRSAPRRAPARASGSVPCDGRYLDLEASRLALTCPRRAEIRRLEAAPSPGPGPAARRRYQRMSVDRASGEPKKRRSSPAGTRKRSRGVDRAEAGGRAVKHAAAGGRMTARWSGVDLRVGRVATSLLPRGSACLVNVWGYGSPHGVLRPKPRRKALWVRSRRLAGSLQRWCRYRVLVT
jgi:hypothetical protein